MNEAAGKSNKNTPCGPLNLHSHFFIYCTNLKLVFLNVITFHCASHRLFIAAFTWSFVN